MATVALIPYRSQLPAMLRDDVQRLGAAILRTLDRIGIRAGQTGVVFDQIRVHRGEFISYVIDTRTLSPDDQGLLLNAVTRDRLQAIVRKPVAVTCDAVQLLIVIDLREYRTTWRERLAHWLRNGRKNHE